MALAVGKQRGAASSSELLVPEAKSQFPYRCSSHVLPNSQTLLLPHEQPSAPELFLVHGP